MTDAELRALIAKARPRPLVQSGRAILLPSGDMLAMLNLAMDVDECYANVALIVAAVNALPALLDRLAAASLALHEIATRPNATPGELQTSAYEAYDAAREGK